MEVKCLNCGIVFESKIDPHGQYFCSNECIDLKVKNLKDNSVCELIEPDIDYMGDSFTYHAKRWLEKNRPVRKIVKRD